MSKYQNRNLYLNNQKQKHYKMYNNNNINKNFHFLNVDKAR